MPRPQNAPGVKPKLANPAGYTRLDLQAHNPKYFLRRRPSDNAFIEAFNGRFRAERLNAHWFLTLADAAETLEACRRDYNEVLPCAPETSGFVVH